MTTVTVRLSSRSEWKYMTDDRGDPGFQNFRPKDDPLQVDSDPTFVVESGQQDEMSLSSDQSGTSSDQKWRVVATWIDPNTAPSPNPGSGYVKVKR